ncbi:MAG: hypothetical protein SAK29_41730 [Scytonema sp. PMC 1069.18]|nr:hypothetical protein [Scytonema sp. PMC 1069.18]MEC4883074.1 hypothetical protein [Scytonema sp. PMC 1070.18]
MCRLNYRAFKILHDEIDKCSGNDEVGKIERQIVIKRLEKLRKEKGVFATVDELRDLVIDVYPQFSEKALKQAARANQPPGFFSKLKWAAILVIGATGVVWIVNLPYPIIRRSVAKTAPILLLPSFMSIDFHYRGAISSVEQADQLVNQATSEADFDLGAKKVKLAQNHLDNLPVWFLGYYPQAYCGWFACTWRFTLDEFEEARRKVARMDAIVFQEKNAFTSLVQGDKAFQAAKNLYEEASNAQDKMQAIASMQGALDTLEQIPRETLAGKQAQMKLVAYNRDFIRSNGNQTYAHQTGTLIEAAKVFALQAAQASQNPPHPAQKWQQIEHLWSQALNRLEGINVDEPNYLQAQKLIAQYQTNLGIVQIRREAETESQEILQQANEEIRRLIAYSSSDTSQLRADIQGTMNKLRSVKAGTTAYAEAQELLRSANNKLAQLQAK